MFSVFYDVLALVQSYENNLFDYVEVDFDTTGLYYDSKHGPNWWNYYFQPIAYGDKTDKSVKEVWGGHPFVNPWHIELQTSRDEAAELIKKYIKLMPNLQKKVDEFVNKNFKGFVIAVHYRGTDKVSEAPRVTYNEMEAMVKRSIKELGKSKYTIFVATDEANFINHMLHAFPDKICYRKNAIRSYNGRPVHFMKGNPYQIGEDAVLDCVLLSKAKLLIRTSSNLSKCSTYFNPNLTVVELNERY